MWPIMLTRAQSDAVVRAARLYLDSVADASGATRAQIGIVVSQLERGISLDTPEQDLLRFMLKSVCAEHGADQHLQTACFRLYGEWWVQPPWWSGTLRMRT